MDDGAAIQNSQTHKNALPILKSYTWSVANLLPMLEAVYSDWEIPSELGRPVNQQQMPCHPFHPLQNQHIHLKGA